MAGSAYIKLTVPQLQQAFLLGGPTSGPNLEWSKFFAGLVGDPQPISAGSLVAVPSPITFTASIDGHLVILGGTSVSVNLTRGRVTVAAIFSNGWLPMSQKDVAVINYVGQPTTYFVPW